MSTDRTRVLEKASASESGLLAHCSVTLVLVSGKDAGTEFPMTTAAMVVGRGPGSDLSFEDDAMSRRHAAFEAQTKSMRVRDLGSTNGTLVNGNKIERYTLDEEDVVGIGQARIRYVPGAGERLAQAMRIDEARQRCEEDTFQESSVNFVGETFKLISTS